MTRFAIFAKYWQPGAVKTRLAATIGHPAASAIARIFLEQLLVRFADIAEQRSLVYAPPEREADFRAIADAGWALMPQAAGDLGQRLQEYFQFAFRAGAERVVVVGSDSPTLPRDYVQQAFAELAAGAPVVLGPTGDGGYYLVGARDETPPIFQDIPWSTSAVWQATSGRLRSRQIRCAVLPEWYDVDEFADLQRVLQEPGDQFTLLRERIAAELVGRDI